MKIEESCFKNAVRTAIGMPILYLAERYPKMRPMLRNVGLRTTESLFGDREVGIPLSPGTILRMTHLSENYLSFQLFWKGIGHYEPITALVLRHLLKPGSTFMDVGANVGFFTLLLSKTVPDLRVIAFEPNPKNYKILNANVTANGLDRVFCEKIAVSDQSGSAKLYFADSDMSASLVNDFQRASNKRQDWTDVETVTLDDYVRRYPSRVPSLIKVDVEGHEEAFMRGTRNTLGNHKPDLILEVLGNHSPEVISLLKDCGYSFYPITNKGYVESAELKRIPPAPFRFLNYLISARPKLEVRSLFLSIQPEVDAIDLYQTCKYMEEPEY